MMKQLSVSRMPSSFDKASLTSIAEKLLSIDKQEVNILNWKDKFPYQPEVSFRLAYDDNNLFLRYDVREKHIRAKASKNNGSVWLDSCVEFFLSPDNDDVYYNFEFNCIGTKLLGYRKLGDETQHGSQEIMDGIRCTSSLGSQPFDEKTGDFSWHLIAVIPFTSCWKHSINNPEGKRMRANFYKCGDELTEPHFLSWNKILTPSPSFHQPGFFGELVFQ